MTPRTPIPIVMSAAAQFLHDNGILLHYNDHLRGLNNLYFIDPVWLADMLAEVVTVPEKNSFVHNGILKESNVAFIFRDNRRFPSKFFQQYLQLLEVGIEFTVDVRYATILYSVIISLIGCFKCTCMHSIHVCKCTHTCTVIHTSTHTDTFTHSHTRVCAHTHTHVHKHAHTHTHTHSVLRLLSLLVVDTVLSPPCYLSKGLP